MTRSLSERLRPFTVFCGFSALLSIVGACLAQDATIFKGACDPTVPMASNFYFYTLVRFEPWALYASAAFFFGLYLVLLRQKVPSSRPSEFLNFKNLPILIALGVLVATGVGRFAVYQNFDLCIDEYLNDFEVRILDQHHLVATLPEEWRDYQSALKVPYENYNANQGYWASGFLPGFASLDYLFSEFGLSWALSPTLAALAILLLDSLARRIFPDKPMLAGNLAILLLALSPQFLAMAMTKFAWTAHLCGTLLWLWLFIHPNRFLFLLTPILGALLIGLHQPHVHPLVAAPFVLRLLYTRQWRDFSWFTFWYLIGAWGWYQVYAFFTAHRFCQWQRLE